MRTRSRSILKSDFGINLPHYQNAEYDRAAVTARPPKQTPQKRRGADYSRPRTVALKDHPLIPLYFYVSKHLA